MPVVISGVVVTIMVAAVMNGIINQLSGIGPGKAGWLTDPDVAIFIALMATGKMSVSM
jgi:ABC-type sugar transport system permease subunit